MHTTSLVPHGTTVKQSKPTYDQQLLASVEKVFRRFMRFPHEHAYTVATLWVAHTHLRGGEAGEKFLPRITPRLFYGSKTPGCGKTTALELTTLMSANGHIAVEPTQPSIISSIEKKQRTIGLDEIDKYFGPNGRRQEGVKAVINAGYKRGATIDCVRGDETEDRNVHAPFCLGGKNAHIFLKPDGPFDTINSRAFSIIMEKITTAHQLEVYDSECHEGRLKSISSQLAGWGLSNGKVITGIDTRRLIPEKIVARDREIWVVLFQIAAFVGGNWPERVENAARALTLGEWQDGDTPQLSYTDELVHACREAFEADEDFLPTRVLLQRLMQVAGWWRDEWTNPRAASMGLADELGILGIEAGRASVNGKQERGYALVDLLDATSDEPEPDEPVVTPVDEWDWDELDED